MNESNDSGDVSSLQPDHVFDAGDLDCGSGLVLLIREQMQTVPEGGVLEMRSVESSVADDLPPWCGMVGHEYLGSCPGEVAGQQRYFLRRGSGAALADEQQALADDKARARDYEWRLRARSSGHLRTTVYCRNFSFDVGQPASFEERDQHPSALEYLFGALAGDLCTSYATLCARQGLEIDDVELTVRGRMHNVLVHLGLEEGDPSLARIEVKCFVSSMNDKDGLRAAWQTVLDRSPLATTLAKAVSMELKLAVV